MTKLTLVIFAATVLAGGLQAQNADPAFRPELVAADFTSREVRPGDAFAMSIKFRNAGNRAARADYRIFVHFEAPEQECTNIVFQDDHEPAEPTTSWDPGRVIVDGPRIINAPRDKPEQEYFVHVGVFDHVGGVGRLMETYDAGKIRITSDAAASEQAAPPPLPEDEVRRRQQALLDRLDPARTRSVDTPDWRFDLDASSGAWLLTDKRTEVSWSSDVVAPVFAEVVLSKDRATRLCRISGPLRVTMGQTGLRVEARPEVDGRASGTTVTFSVTPTGDGSALRMSYSSQSTTGWAVTRVRPLSEALWVTETEDGNIYIPFRLGIDSPANAGLPGRKQWTTYNNLSMAMCGATKGGSALLLSWEDVDANLAVTTRWPDLPLVPGRRMKAISVDLRGPDGSVLVQPLGEGGYVEIARAYRAIAREKGWRRTWADKRRDFPTVDRMFGAADFKPFVFSRVVPGSRYNQTDQERTHLGFTFDEAAQCAEHWRRDLGIDRAFVVLAGWINGGYDVRHPDPLPAAPECGGDEGMKDAMERIKACGYLAGGHDNYQDMYMDAPSWGEEYINKTANGQLKMGGNWNGGQAYQVCAIKQVELAAREKTNLPEIKRLFGPTVFFIDTVFAWPLVTCEDPDHPMTRLDDLKWKTRLCMLAKEQFGMFGSEEGREWAVPCADYLEGIFGHQTDEPPGAVIPLFQLVYSDCVQIMTHQGNRIAAGDEKKMADHILFAEMHLPNFGSHLYWRNPEGSRVPVNPLPPIVKPVGERTFEITYRWQVLGPVAQDFRSFVHFTHEAADHPEKIAYQNDHTPSPGTSTWQANTIVGDGPHTVEIPEKYRGVSQINVGFTSAGGRATLGSGTHDRQRYRVGEITLTDEGIEYQPVAGTSIQELWSRGETGWGRDLCTTDRVIKNTWEVLSPLNVITAERPLDSHEFLTDDRLLQRTRFGDLTITVAYDRAFEVNGNRIPAYGFIAESPRFVAFCATRYNGLEYASPTLFTARSLDGRPLTESSQIRIYHGFGDPRVNLCGKVFEVQREAIVSMP